ncbi:hypothetical protein EBR77_00245 [bacterium]|nr:hypothetical protein [bacterium]NBX78230.1 hypothetical protein [bacterium]
MKYACIFFFILTVSPLQAAKEPSVKDCQHTLNISLQSAIELFPEIESIAWEIETDTSGTRKYTGLCAQSKAMRIVLQYYLTLLTKQIDGQHNNADALSIAHLIHLYAAVQSCEAFLQSKTL